jgi:hypothetical protein
VEALSDFGYLTFWRSAGELYDFAPKVADSWYKS